MKNAIELIKAQQEKVKERSAPWMVGEQLKDICRAEPESAEILARDLEVEKMSIAEAEKKIRAFAGGADGGGAMRDGRADGCFQSGIKEDN